MSLTLNLIKAIHADDLPKVRKIIEQIEALPAVFKQRVEKHQQEQKEFLAQFPDATPLPVPSATPPQEDTKFGIVENGEYQGQTALGFAAKTGKIEFVRLLLERGFPVDYAKGEDTPLALAAIAGHVEIVGYLRLMGADPYPAGAKATDILERIVRNDHVKEKVRAQVLKAFLNPAETLREQKSETKSEGEMKGVSADLSSDKIKKIDWNKTYTTSLKIFDTVYESKVSILDVAALKNLPLLLDLLITDPKSVVLYREWLENSSSRTKFSYGYSYNMLDYASLCGFNDVVEVLLKKGGDSITPVVLAKAIHIACQGKKSETVMVLLNHPQAKKIDFKNETSLFHLPDNRCVGLVKAFIKSSGNLLEVAILQQRPPAEIAKLWVSYEISNPEILEAKTYAASFAKDLTVKKKHQLTPLEFAVYKNDLEEVKKELGLLSEDKITQAIFAGKKIWPDIQKQRYVMTWAIQKADFKIVQELFNRVKGFIQPDRLHKLLNFAACCNKKQVVELFLTHAKAKEINFDHPDNSGTKRELSKLTTDAAKFLQTFWYTQKLTPFEREVFEKPDTALKTLTEQKETKLGSLEAKQVTALDLVQDKTWPNHEAHCPLTWALKTGRDDLAAAMLAKMSAKDFNGEFLKKVLLSLVEKNLMKAAEQLLGLFKSDKGLEKLRVIVGKTFFSDTKFDESVRDLIFKEIYGLTDLALAVYKDRTSRVGELLDEAKDIPQLLELSFRFPSSDYKTQMLPHLVLSEKRTTLKIFLEKCSKHLKVDDLKTALLHVLPDQTECLEDLLCELSKLDHRFAELPFFGGKTIAGYFKGPQQKLVVEKVIAEADKMRAAKVLLEKKYLQKLISERAELIKSMNPEHLLGKALKEPVGTKDAKKEPANKSWNEINQTEMGRLEPESKAISLPENKSEYSQLVNMLSRTNLIGRLEDAAKKGTEDKESLEMVSKLKANPGWILSLSKEKEFLTRLLIVFVIIEANQPLTVTAQKPKNLESLAPMTYWLQSQIAKAKLWDALFPLCEGATLMHYVYKARNEEVVKAILQSFVPVAPYSLLKDIKYWHHKKCEIPEKAASASVIKLLREKEMIALQQNVTLFDFFRYYLRKVREVNAGEQASVMAARYIGLMQVLVMLFDKKTSDSPSDGNKNWQVNIKDMVEALVGIFKDETHFSNMGEGTAENILKGLMQHSAEELQRQASDLKEYLQFNHPAMCAELERKWGVKFKHPDTSKTMNGATKATTLDKGAASGNGPVNLGVPQQPAGRRKSVAEGQVLEMLKKENFSDRVLAELQAAPLSIAPGECVISAVTSTIAPSNLM